MSNNIMLLLVTDKNNTISFEGFEKHYHQHRSSSYQTLCDTCDDVCLDLHNCHYSIYIYQVDKKKVSHIFSQIISSFFLKISMINIFLPKTNL